MRRSGAYRRKDFCFACQHQRGTTVAALSLCAKSDRGTRRKPSAHSARTLTPGVGRGRSAPSRRPKGAAGGTSADPPLPPQFVRIVFRLVASRLVTVHFDSYRWSAPLLHTPRSGTAVHRKGSAGNASQVRRLNGANVRLSATTDAARSRGSGRRALDRRECELLVVLARQAADADRADPPAVLEHGDAAEEEGEERVEARALDRIGARLLGELPRRCRVAACGRVGLALRVQPSIRRRIVHRYRRDQ